MSIRVATDIGGTFTDLVYLDEDTGRYGLAKVPTTPASFEQGILDAIRRARIDTAAVTHFVHGTTVVINAITERKGATVGLLTTAGMRDVLEIARGNRPDIYNLRYQKPKPFVPRWLRCEARERMDAQGRVVFELDEADVRHAADVFRRANVQAIAICFLHAYANPAHEQRAGDMIAALLPGVYLSLSHEITREWREYERTNTAVMNSYVGPTTRRYLDTLEGGLRGTGVRGSCFVMQSNGGAATFAEATRTPINMVESGPAGGVIGAAELGKALGAGELITLDIGGTTAKTSLISNHTVNVTTDYKLEWTQRWAGYPVKVPVVDIVEIGAGGGSIAWLDEDGAVRVGPRSAGADPGPAAYGRPGGIHPTVTDAQLIAGRLNPDFFLGGAMALDGARAYAVYACLAGRCGVGVEDMAYGILRIANANMMNALKLISVQRGHDPRDFALVAMGGGGPLHAAYLARELQIARTIIPISPGHFSAFGMLTTDLRRDYIRTAVFQVGEDEPASLEARYVDMEERALRDYGADGFDADQVYLVRAADMRYRGQEHTVHVAAPRPLATAPALGELSARFHAAHEQRYSFRLTSPIELVNLHVTAFGAVARPRLPRIAARSGDGGAPCPAGTRPVWFEDEGIVEAPVYDRDGLLADDCVAGPAIVEEAASTTLVYAAMTLHVDHHGNLIIETGA